MAKDYLSIQSLNSTCQIDDLNRFKHHAYFLDQVFGNADGKLNTFEMLQVEKDSYRENPLIDWKNLRKDFQNWDLESTCPEIIESRSTDPVVFLKKDPSLKNLDQPFIYEVQKKIGRSLRVEEWLYFFPNAQLRGKGPSLRDLALKTHRGIPLKLALIDQNGDLDLSFALKADLKKWSPRLLLRQEDDWPVSVPYFLKHAKLKISPKTLSELEQQSLSKFIHDAASGDFVIDLGDLEFLQKIKADPSLSRIFYVQAQRAEKYFPDQEDHDRMAFVLAFDSEGSELILDEAIVNASELNKREVLPEVYASYKVNPNHLDQGIAIYTPLYTRSLRPQGQEGKGAPPKRGYVHQADAESIYLLFDSEGILQEAMGDTHYYLTRANETQLEEIRKNKTLIYAVSFRAHGKQIAQQNPQLVEAKTGSLKAGSGAYLKDEYPGLDEMNSKKSILLNPQVRIDEEAWTSLKTQFGKTIGKKGWGFNDGIRLRRLRDDLWRYSTDPIFEFLDRVERGYTDHIFALSVAYLFSLPQGHRVNLNWQLPLPKREGWMIWGAMGVMGKVLPDFHEAEIGFHSEFNMGYGRGAFLPYFSLGLNVPIRFDWQEDRGAISLGLETMLYPISFHGRRVQVDLGLGLLLQVPQIVDDENFSLGFQDWLVFQTGLRFAFEFGGP